MIWLLTPFGCQIKINVLTKSNLHPIFIASLHSNTEKRLIHISDAFVLKMCSINCTVRQTSFSVAMPLWYHTHISLGNAITINSDKEWKGQTFAHNAIDDVHLSLSSQLHKRTQAPHSTFYRSVFQKTLRVKIGICKWPFASRLTKLYNYAHWIFLRPCTVLTF